MNKMLRKKLMPAEFLVASSLLLAPGIALTGYAQNTSPSSPQATPSGGIDYSSDGIDDSSRRIGYSAGPSN